MGKRGLDLITKPTQDLKEQRELERQSPSRKKGGGGGSGSGTPGRSASPGGAGGPGGSGGGGGGAGGSGAASSLLCARKSNKRKKLGSPFKKGKACRRKNNGERKKVPQISPPHLPFSLVIKLQRARGGGEPSQASGRRRRPPSLASSLSSFLFWRRGRVVAVSAAAAAAAAAASIPSRSHALPSLLLRPTFWPLFPLFFHFFVQRRPRTKKRERVYGWLGALLSRKRQIPNDPSAAPVVAVSTWRHALSTLSTTAVSQICYTLLLSADRFEVPPYEEMALYYPQANQRRPLILVGERTYNKHVHMSNSTHVAP